MKKVGIDIHGTIDKDPDFFRKFINILKNSGIEIHITTGRTIEYAKRELGRLDIYYDYIFSITDYHKNIGTLIIYDEKGNPWIDDELWDRAKGDYCFKESIDLHIDDSESYKKYFKTRYLQYKHP